VHGVVEGSVGYGNALRVPTGGAAKCGFHPAYNGNCLVKCLWPAGLADARPRFSIPLASGVRHAGCLTLAPTKTGRAVWAAQPWPAPSLNDSIEEKAPNVQVGDPFTEKRLMEACMELGCQTGAVDFPFRKHGAAGS